MIELKKLQELIQLMKDNDLCELDIRNKDEQVTLKRPCPGLEPGVHAHPGMMPPPAPAQMPNPPQADQPAGAGVASAYLEITSPMVGTFYASPSPDAEPFVRVGNTVDENTVVCLLEAMKVFNEIKAECSGTIERMLVASGQAVEFGQPLFLVKPS